MPLAELQVGPLTVTGTAKTIARAGQQGDLIVSELHGHYYEQNYRGKVFNAATQALVTTTVGLAALLGNSNLAGVVLSGASTFQEQTLLSTVQLYGPAQYWIAIHGNGTAAGAIRTIAASTFPDVLAGSIAGTFGTVPATITLPTTFTATKGPFVYVK